MLEDKKVIIFDLDGTLIDSVGIWNKVDAEAIKELSGKVIDLDIIQKERNQILLKNKDKSAYQIYGEYLVKKYNMPYSLEEVMDKRSKIAYKYTTQVVDYKENADKVLKKLKEIGYLLVLATTSVRRTIDQYNNHNKNIIHKAKINDIFDLVLTSESVTNKKPSPEIYLKVLEELKIDRKDALVVEDSLEGVQAAKGAGIEVLNIPDDYSKRDQDEIDKLSNYKLDNFKVFLDILNKYS